MKAGAFIYTVLFTTLVSFLLVLPVTYINEKLSLRIIWNKNYEEQKTVLSVCRIPFKNRDELFELYKSYVQTREVNRMVIYIVQTPVDIYYAVRFSGNGVWGPITGMLTVDRDVTKIKSIQIIKQQEIMGSKLRLPAFLFRFIDASFNARGRIEVILPGSGDMDKSKGIIDGISGATITSKLFAQMINRTIAELRINLKGVQ